MWTRKTLISRAALSAINPDSEARLHRFGVNLHICIFDSLLGSNSCQARRMRKRNARAARLAEMFTHSKFVFFATKCGRARERRQLARRAPLNRSKWSGAARRMDFLVSAEPWLRNYTMHCTLARLCWRLRGKERDAEPDRVLIQSTTPDAADTHAAQSV
jgi:hypothetical protein